ncbi:hypothetical protein APTSU1_000248600 [Apodemus speciosus]|uniref:Uncharacterized protein n=1 Tax=Apodemus speciosus TaxID=105296 RepID=A0ABQ0EJT0_APOSI
MSRHRDFFTPISRPAICPFCKKAANVFGIPRRANFRDQSMGQPSKARRTEFTAE